MRDKDMNLYIHVGPHKTGTSAIQAFMHKNHDALRERGAWYLGWAGATNQTYLAHAFLKAHPAAPEMLHRYLDAATNAGCDICILSSEAFSKKDFDPGALLLSLGASQATFIAYLRRPDDRLVSVFGQLVRQNRRIRPIGESWRYDPTYRTYLEKWALAEGHRLLLSPYDVRQWPDGSLVNDFLANVGIDPDGLDRSMERQETNRSLPGSLTEALRLANGLDISEETRQEFLLGLQALAESRPDLFAGGDLLDTGQRIALRQELRDSLDVWRQYYRPGFDERFLFEEDS